MSDEKKRRSYDLKPFFGGHCVFIEVIIKDLMTSGGCVVCPESVTVC